MRMKSLAALLTGLLSVSCFFAMPALADDADGQSMQQAAPSDNNIGITGSTPSDNVGQTDESSTNNNTDNSSSDNSGNNNSGNADSGSPDTATGEDY